MQRGGTDVPRVAAAALIISTALLCSGSVHAGERDVEAAQAPDPAPASTESEPWLLGDWNGLRTGLKKRGIDFQFGYTGEFAYNPTGGSETGATYTDQYAAGVTFDLDRLIGLSDAQFQTTLTERTGRNLSDDADLGTLQQVQEVYGRGQTIRLTDFWFQQKYADGLIDWKVGRIPVGEDFASFSCDFQNLTFCGSDPGNIVGDYIFNWPISQWATRLKLNLDGFGYFEAGVYDVNPKYLSLHDQVLPVFFPGSTGALIPVELAWLPTFGDGKLPGSYKFGAWYDTSTADDVVDDINGDPVALTGLPPLHRRGRYGGYINFQQQLTADLSVFVNAVVADRRTSTTDRQIAAGLIYTGPFSARPQDDVGFAAGTTHVNSRVADVQSLENALGRGPIAVQGSEYAFELYYTFRPDLGFLIRPNVQYIHHPGGTNQNDDVFVLGLKTSANF
jgi:porin